jgi:hypothetical protein
MDIEMVFDPRQHAAEAHLTLDWRHEVLPDGEWIRWARRLLERDDLFVYRHRENGTYMLCNWLFREPDIANEVHQLPGHPDRGPHFSARFLKAVARPFDELAREIAAGIRERRANENALKAESRGEQIETANHYRVRGQEDIATGIMSSSYVGEREGGESLAQMKAELAAAAKPKIQVGT